MEQVGDGIVPEMLVWSPMEQVGDGIVPEREAEYVPNDALYIVGNNRSSISPVVTTISSDASQEVEMFSSAAMITESADLMDIFGVSSMEIGFESKVSGRRVNTGSSLDLPLSRLPTYPDSTLNDKLVAAEATNSRLVDEIDRILRRNTDEKDELRRKYEDDVRRARNQLKESNERYAKLLEKSEKLDVDEFDMNELKNVCDNLKGVEREQQNKIDKLSNDNLSLRTDIMALKNETTKFRSESSHLKAANDTVIAENGELRAELMSFKTSHDTNKDLDMKRTEERLIKLNEDVLLYENRIALLEAENGSLRRRLNDMDILDREFNKIKRHTTNLESEIRSLMAQNGHLRLYSSGVPVPGGAVQTAHFKSNYSPQYHDHSDYSKDNTFQLGNNTSHYNYESLVNSQRDHSPAATSTIPHRDYNTTTTSGQREYNTAANSTNAINHSSRDIQNIKSGNYSQNTTKHASDVNTASQQPIKDSASDNRPKSPGTQSLGDVVAGLPPKAVSNTSPFGTDSISATISKTFDELERRLTALMTEKTALQDETEKLHQRGCKTLKERTRLTQAEARLKEVGKEISATRKELLGKPS